MKRQFPLYSLLTAGAMMVGFTAVVTGLTVALDTTGATAGAVSTTTVTPAPEFTTFSVDVSTGTITQSSGNATNGTTVVDSFTALLDTIPQDLANKILADTAIPQSATFISDLTAIAKDATNDPSAYEFLTQITPVEVAYGLSTTTTVTTTTGGVLGHDNGKGNNYHNNGVGNQKNSGNTTTTTTTTTTGPLNLVVNPSSVTDVTNLSQLAAATIGGCNATGSVTLVGQPTFTETGDLLTSTSTTDVGGMTLVTVTDQQLIGTIQLNLYQVTGTTQVTPIVLDVSGSGRLQASHGQWLPHRGAIDMKTTRLYDFYNNGFPMAMEWVGPKDGLLVEPKADGSVDGSCLFGSQGGWSSGYEKLSMRDKNGDGRLTGDELKGLSVWVDANGDAVCQPSELKSVQDMGITEIDLHQNHMASVFVMNGKSHRMWDWSPNGLEVKHVSKATALQEIAADKEATAH